MVNLPYIDLPASLKDAEGVRAGSVFSLVFGQTVANPTGVNASEGGITVFLGLDHISAIMNRKSQVEHGIATHPELSTGRQSAAVIGLVLCCVPECLGVGDLCV